MIQISATLDNKAKKAQIKNGMSDKILELSTKVSTIVT